MYETTVDITIGEEDFILDVSYRVWGAHRNATFHSPAECPEMEYEATLNGKPYDPTPEEHKQILEACWEKADADKEEAEMSSYDY